MAVIGLIGSQPALAATGDAPVLQASSVNLSALTSLAQQYLTDRADKMVEHPALSPATLTNVAVGSTFAMSIASDAVALNSLRAADQSAGVDYVSATVQLKNPTVSVASNGTVQLHVTDDTRMYFKPVPGAPPYEEWSVGRTFDFSGIGASAQLIGASLDDASGPVPTTDIPPARQVNASLTALPTGAASTTRPALDTASPIRRAVAATGGYNYAAMVNYETTYWNGSDPYRWPTMPEDCTNFLSQALAAGGWAFVGSIGRNSNQMYNPNDWYMNYMAGRGGYETYTVTWSVAENWYRYSRSSGRVTALSNVWSTATSDVIQIKFAGDSTMDHSMMVTSVDSNNGHYMTYHTTNSLNRPLSEIIAKYPGATWFADRT